MDKLSAGPRVVRAPALRRGREITPLSERAKLERVLGLTVSSNAALDCDPQQSVVAYPAGCVVVLYNVRKNRQNHILSSSKKTITSLAFSWDGKYLATGECGHQPHLRVWDIQDCSQIAEFPGHKFGINCVAFSPNLKYVVSVGSQHDMIVNVWDWKNNIKVASNKVSCKVKALSFSAGGNYFVTVGNRHVKFWYLEYSRSTKYKLEPVPLMGRSAILGDQRNNYFCDVACGRGEMADSTYAITKSGLLCVFNSRRLLEKWVELKTTSANSICVAEDYIFIGCAEGIVRCFSPFSLQYISTLPKPHYLGVDVAKGVTGSHISSHPTGAKYPDTVAITFDETCRKVTCIYNDHSLYIWDIKDIKKVGKSHSSMYHSACIWGVETYPEISDKQRSVVPPGTFLTCSSDDTIRVWNMTPNLNHNSNFQKNIYSSDLLKVLYTDPELAYLCDVDFNPAGSNDKVDTTYDGKNGVRCLRISHDGRHLASGDRSGNVRICDLHTMEVLYKIEAHDSEVLCLEYSKPINGRRYLASASRDRLIHVFDVNQDYSFQQTLDDHSSSITAVRFVQNTSQLQMISCGADKSIIFRRAQFSPQLSFMREHHVVGRTTLYDMEVDSAQRHILTACQDRNIRVYSVNNVKNTRSFRGSQGEDGTLIKLVLDSTGTYLATSCTNKSLYIYDYYSGECVASMFGHSELVTGLKFTNDGNHLISVSGDGCIFVWKLPVEVTQAMLSRQTLSEATSLPSVWQDGRRSAVAVTKPLQTLEKEAEKTEMNNNSLSPDAQENSKEGNTPGYRFSMGQLPFWAKKQMFENLSDNNRTTDQRTPPLVQPRGRWAQRLDGQGLIVKSYLNSDSVIPFPNIPNQQGDSNLSTIQFRHQKESLIQQKEESSYEEFEISEESMQEIQTGNYQKQITGRTTLRQGRETQLTSPSGTKKDPRIRHPTDSSSASSLKLEDVEAEDERSDTEITEASEAVYYLPSGDNSEMGERSFHINTTTEEDLRESRRKQRGSSKLERLRDIPVSSDYNELNSDDEDPATPVEENRSILHSLSFSTENLERLGKREKFMKSNYESLEKGPVDSQIKKVTDNNIGYMPRHSISAKFLARSLQTASVRPTSSETEKEKGSDNQKADSKPNKREELTRALNEARKKLETLGWKGGLSNSKSMGDLYNVTDSETTEKPKTESSVENSIRRTASISDLSTPSSTCRRLLPTTPTCKTLAGSQSSTAPLWAQAKTQPDDQTSGELLTPWNNMSRSASMSSLQPRDDKGPSSGSILLKVPSIHTLAKVPGTPRRTGLGASPLSKAPSTSSVSALGRPGTTLSTPRRLSLRSLEPLKLPPDSSSSDSSPTEPQSSHPVGRVVSMGRERGLSTAEFGKGKGYSNDPNKFLHNTLTSRKLLTSNDPSRSKSERDLSRLGKDSGYDTSSSTQAKVEPMMSVLPKVNDDDSVNINKISSDEMSSLSMEKGSITLFTKPSSVPLTQDLCVKVAEELKRVTSYAIQIFQRVTVDTELPAAEKSTMTTTLAQGVLQAQQNLRPAVPPMPMWNPSGASLDTTNPFGNVKRMTMSSSNLLSSDFVQHSMGKKLDPTSQPEMVNAMALLQQYSDRLLNLVEQRMNKGSGQEKSD